MFINLIKMMIVPVVFTSLIVGVTSLGDTKKLGRIGLKTLVLYLLTTAIAIIIGFAVAGVSHPGVGMHITNGTVQAAKAAPSIMQVILDMIPSSPVQSMAKSDILPVIVFALFIGVGIGVVAVTKAQAYVKANTPDTARQFLLGPDQDHVTMRTLEGLVNEFNATRRAREAELNSKYAARNE